MGILKNKSDKANVSKEFHSSRKTKVGSELSFGAAEAYKLLRTNLMFSIPQSDNKCNIIGVTSPLESEGKSTTVVNLGYSIAESGKKVLIIDCDLRKPSIHRYLKLKSAPGISNVLAGMCKPDTVIMESGVIDNLSVVPVGDLPPNPSELIGSEYMNDVIECYSDKFDYIFFDLPPVNAVADALVASKVLHGIIVVVAQNYCIQGALNETMRQLEFLKIKVLGFVVTKGSGLSAKYGKYSKYGRYKRYGRYYRYGYGRKYRRDSAYKYGGYYGTGSMNNLPDNDINDENQILSEGKENSDD